MTTAETAPERTAEQIYEPLEAIDGNVVALRMHEGTRADYHDLYQLLAEKTAEHGSIDVYEETTDWTAWTFLTHIAGLVPDLRCGSDFHIERYAAVCDSRWAKLLYDWWRVIRPVWPVAPEEMRYFERDNREAALEWVKHGDEP